MPHQPLARQWRPKTFQQIIGQELTLRMLVNALDHQRLHHAYLFTGTRGVGKTTLARLLAKCLNCETGITSNPCGTCSICQAIDAGKFLDLIEVDAASRTKVEDTREILDNVQYAPTQGRFKIYLIDEVHMLSGHSFNALLKTLEEPPAHVKFLLATTDPKRLPVTILSRCLQFHLKRVPVEQIKQHLQTICDAEKIAYEASALELVAQAADGSLRDALSILDQTIALCGEKITLPETRSLLGNIEQEVIFRLIQALADNNGKQLLTEVSTLSEQAPDFNQVLEVLLSTLHQISLTQLIPDLNEQAESIKQFAKTFSAESIQLYYQIALIGRKDLPLAANPQQGFEMVMLRMLAFRPVPESGLSTQKPVFQETFPAERTSPEKNQAIQGKFLQKNPVSNIEKNQTIPQEKPLQENSISNTKKTQTIPQEKFLRENSILNTETIQTIPQEKSSRENSISNPHATQQSKPTVETPTESFSGNWSEILSKLQLTGMAQALASNCTLLNFSNHQITLALASQHEPMLNKKLTDRIESALAKHFNQTIKLDIKLITEEIYTPAKQKAEEQIERKNLAKENIQNDHYVKKMVELFDATLDVDSIKTLDENK